MSLASRTVWARIGIAASVIVAVSACSSSTPGSSSSGRVTCQGETDGIVLTDLTTCNRVILLGLSGSDQTWDVVTNPSALNSLTPVCTFRGGSAVYDPENSGDGDAVCGGIQANDPSAGTPNYGPFAG